MILYRDTSRHGGVVPITKFENNCRDKQVGAVLIEVSIFEYRYTT